MSTNTSVIWFWDRTVSPFKSGPYLCTIGKVELERKGDKSSRHVWCFTWGRFDNRPDDPNSWIDFDEDGEWMIVAWAELPPACDIGQRLIQDKIDEIDEAHKIVIRPDSAMREIPITKEEAEEDKEIFAGPQFNPNELASMTIGEFVRIIKEIK